MTSSPDAPPLAGVRVVDLSRVLAGPYATMTLADLGADVVKVEHPVGGDETRSWATNEARVRNRESLVAELEAVFASRPTEDWVRLLLSSGVPAGKIRGVGEALRMAAETGVPATAGVAHPTAGTVELVAPPFSFDRASLRPPEAPPLLGQHTAEVLDELGVDAERLSALEHSGVIAQARPA